MDIFSELLTDFNEISLHSSLPCVTLVTCSYWEVWLCCIVVNNCILCATDGCLSSPDAFLRNVQALQTIAQITVD